MQGDSINIGGSVGDGSAVGRGARGGNVSKGGGGAQVDEIRQLLDDLTRAVRDHRAELDDPDELSESIAAVREELSAPQPRKGVVTTVLKGVVAGAGGVSAIADAASKIRALVGAFL